MLSPHELSMLLLIKSATESIDLDHTDLNALLQQQLVSRQRCDDGIERLALTPAGLLMVRAIMSTAGRNVRYRA
ncbi:hypothetical protein LMG24235_07719 [Paraburkholderia sabiae]|jgi:hypothetical protein|nr:hypothetical protein LMG24235_07719 [Paraburkholderia sabiae]CAG9229135.1 conserved hypothetical protein [Paraburkholderia sabiae]